MKRVTKKSIRLRILKLGYIRATERGRESYKKIDPFADTGTQLRHQLGLG